MMEFRGARACTLSPPLRRLPVSNRQGFAHVAASRAALKTSPGSKESAGIMLSYTCNWTSDLHGSVFALLHRHASRGAVKLMRIRARCLVITTLYEPNPDAHWDGPEYVKLAVHPSIGSSLPIPPAALDLTPRRRGT